MSRKGAFIVSGAGSGIGRSIASKIAREGHHVFGVGRDPRKLEATARELGPESFSFSSIDLARADDGSRLVQSVRRWLVENNLPLLGVVNNAGVFDRLPFLSTSDSLWEKHFQNNLLSAVRLSRDFFEQLKSAAPSAVLNISSTLGVRPVAGTAAYSATKAAMVNWTQCLALEWAPYGIRVNCICPGIVDTPIHGFHQHDDTTAERSAAHALHPLGRMGTVEDIAEAAWFFLSDKSSWTTGAILPVDGGISL
ncbi:MAG: SDR family NAD(P)-dependent oxidoreductase [Bdellovibrionales bacterium]